MHHGSLLTRRPGAKRRRRNSGGAFYIDVSAGYALGPAEFFFAVKNLPDKDPPILAAGTGVPNISQTNVSLYDVLGRNYRAGIRFDF
jgi:outer membrane receptor protein involved in Fe transport